MMKRILLSIAVVVIALIGFVAYLILGIALGALASI